MAEILTEFEQSVRDEAGREYFARALGQACGDGHWEGWIEFIPREGGAIVRTARETTQPNRVDTAYWASGLSAVYLEGALRRALDPLRVGDRIIDDVGGHDRRPG